MRQHHLFLFPSAVFVATVSKAQNHSVIIIIPAIFVFWVGVVGVVFEVCYV